MNTTFDRSLPIAIGCDHAGYDYKEAMRPILEELGWQVSDKGTYGRDSVDYPDFAHAVAGDVETGKAAAGVLICGSGNGVCITANRHHGVRAALCWQEDLAELARQHNNANVICIPARFVSPESAEKMVRIFLSTAFEGGRHENRVNKIEH